MSLLHHLIIYNSNSSSKLKNMKNKKGEKNTNK